MTRGREVQDFIKANKKTAREKFEEQGWTYERNKTKLKSNERIVWDDISYKKDHYVVMFDLVNERFECYSGELGSAESIGVDMELNRLIQYQIKELGWV